MTTGITLSPSDDHAAFLGRIRPWLRSRYRIERDWTFQQRVRTRLDDRNNARPIHTALDFWTTDVRECARRCTRDINGKRRQQITIAWQARRIRKHVLDPRQLATKL
jgi:hypothetical protein